MTRLELAQVTWLTQTGSTVSTLCTVKGWGCTHCNVLWRVGGVLTAMYWGVGVYPPHCKGQGYTHRTVLRGVGCDVFEGPLDVLVLGQLPGEVAGVHAAQTQQAIVGRQHAAVEQHDLLVLMVSPAQAAPHTAQLVSTTHIAPSGQYYTNSTSWSALHTQSTIWSVLYKQHHLVSTIQTAPSGQYYTNSTIWSVLYKQHHLVSTIQTAPAGQYYTNTIWSVLYKQHHLVSTIQTAPSGQYYTNSTIWSVLYKQHHLVSTTHTEHDLVSTIQTAPAGQYYTNTIWSVLYKQHHLVSTIQTAPSGQHYTHRAPSGQYYTNSTIWSVLHKLTAPAGQYYTNSTSWSVLHKHHLVSTIQTTPAGQYYTNTIWSVLHKQHQLISTTQTARHKDKQHNVLVKTTQRQQYNVLVKTTQRQSDLPVLLIGWGGAHVRHICEWAITFDCLYVNKTCQDTNTLCPLQWQLTECSWRQCSCRHGGCWWWAQCSQGSRHTPHTRTSARPANIAQCLSANNV